MRYIKKFDIFHLVNVTIKHFAQIKTPKIQTITMLLYVPPFSECIGKTHHNRTKQQPTIDCEFHAHDWRFTSSKHLLQFNSIIHVACTNTNFSEIFVVFLLQIQLKFSIRFVHFVAKFGSRGYSSLKLYSKQKPHTRHIEPIMSMIFPSNDFFTLCMKQKRVQNTLNCLAYMLDMTKDLKKLRFIYIWRRAQRDEHGIFLDVSCHVTGTVFLLLIYMQVMFMKFVSFFFNNKGVRQRLLLSFGLSTNIKTILSTKKLPQVI